MKRPAFIVPIITLIFISCSSPQATVTPEATVTPTLISSVTPSPTLEPPTNTPEPTPTLSPSEKAQAELTQFHLDPADFEITTNADGETEAKGLPGTEFAGKIIFKDNLWNSETIAKIVENSLKITGDCEKTPFPAGTNIMDKAFKIWKEELFFTRAKDAGVQILKSQHWLNNPFRTVTGGNCWGFFMVLPGQPVDIEHADTFFWPDKKGVVHLVELFLAKSK